MSNIPVLRLPPDQSKLSPIVNIGAREETCGSMQHNFKLNEVWKLAEAKFETVTVKQRQNICCHVEKVEVEYL